MIYKTANDLIGTDREAVGDGWKSRRFLLAEDGLPFSLHETTVAVGAKLHLKYESHSETVYCIEGKASVEEVARNKVFPIDPGTFYSSGIGDEHILCIEEKAQILVHI